MIRFTLRAPTPSLNETLRWHWSRKRNWQQAVAWQIYCDNLFKDWRRPLKPHVRIIRYGSRLLDQDNLVGGCKGLIDVLKPGAKSNPFGLGIIAGDEPDKLTLVVEQVKSSRADARTVVEIREMDDE